jgi:hypothetical protein
MVKLGSWEGERLKILKMNDDSPFCRGGALFTHVDGWANQLLGYILLLYCCLPQGDVYCPWAAHCVRCGMYHFVSYEYPLIFVDIIPRFFSP